MVKLLPSGGNLQRTNNSPENGDPPNSGGWRNCGGCEGLKLKIKYHYSCGWLPLKSVKLLVIETWRK